MLPIVDKPLIQYAVEDAIAAGITELIFVTSGSKRAIEDHFDTNHELENNLLERGKQKLLEIVQGILPEGISCAYIRQEPFAVLLADDLIDGGQQSCLQQMMAVFAETQSSVIAVEKISPAETKRYGVVDVLSTEEVITPIQGIIEKPSFEQAPSNLGVVGRYILTPTLFEFLENISKGSNGEIQLTDAIAQLLQKEKVMALQFTGKRYDCGSKIGYLEATIAYALKHPELAHDFGRLLKDFQA
jgi:UTP--glucose-1-phosphate uridylyltransferase